MQEGMFVFDINSKEFGIYAGRDLKGNEYIFRKDTSNRDRYIKCISDNYVPLDFDRQMLLEKYKIYCDKEYNKSVMNAQLHKPSHELLCNNSQLEFNRFMHNSEQISTLEKGDLVLVELEMHNRQNSLVRYVVVCLDKVYFKANQVPFNEIGYLWIDVTTSGLNSLLKLLITDDNYDFKFINKEKMYFSFSKDMNISNILGNGVYKYNSYFGKIGKYNVGHYEFSNIKTIFLDDREFRKKNILPTKYVKVIF